MQRLRVGDRVQVISGKDKGKQGRVSKVIAETGKVVVEGVNVVKKHEKPSQKNPQGGIIQKEAAIWASKVMPIDPETGKPTRVKVKVAEDGKKTRIAKSGAAIVAELSNDRRKDDASHARALREAGRSGSPQGAQAREPDGSAATRKDRGQHGSRRGGG